MGNHRGFTLLETIISSTIIATIMLGLVGILASSSKSAGKSRDVTFAANLASQEVDVIMSDMKVQQSLVSKDNKGRASKSLIYVPSTVVGATDTSVVAFVLDYFFDNFREINPDSVPDVNGVRADPINKGTASYFDLAEGNRFYDLNGVYLGALQKLNAKPGAKYVSRVQVLGIPQEMLNDRSLPSVENDASGPGGANGFLMGDTNDGTGDADANKFITYNGNQTYPLRKLVIVRIYDYADYVKLGAMDLSNPKINGRELIKMKLIVYGDA